MISFENVSFAFDDTRIFEKLNLKITAPVTCIMGASGQGKTTLLRLASGLNEPDSGHIVSDYRRPAFMFQDDRLFPWLNAVENIEVAAKSRSEAVAMLEAVEMSDSADKKPAELSGGMKRRLALARALLFDGDLLILDEPFNGMDPELKARMAALILKRGLPVIFTSHLEAEAELLGAEIMPLNTTIQ